MNRAEVREVADLYYARFDARLEKGLAEVRSEMQGGFAELRSEQVRLRSDTEKGFAQLRIEMVNQRADLLKWMFAFWLSTIAPLAGLMIALHKL